MRREFALDEKIEWLERKNSAARPVFALAAYNEAKGFYSEMNPRRGFSDYVYLKDNKGKIISITQAHFKLLRVTCSLALMYYETARFMNKSEHIIKKQISSILKQFGVYSRVELVATLVKNGFLTYEPNISENHFGPRPQE